MENEKEFRFKLNGKTFVVIDWANVYGWFKNLGWKIDPEKLYQYLISYPDISKVYLYFGVEKGNRKSEEFQKQIKGIGYDLISKEVKWVPVSLETSHFKKMHQNLLSLIDGMKSELHIEDDWEKLSYDEMMDKIHRGAEEYLEEYQHISEVYIHHSIFYIKQFLEEINKPIMRRKCDFDVEISRDIYNNLANFETLLIFSGDGDYAALAQDLIFKKKKVIVVFAPGHKGKEYEDFKKGLFLCSIKQVKPFIVK